MRYQGSRVEQFIDGVQVTLLKLVPNERGRLMEVLRADEPWFAGFGQIYVTQSFNGIVKAWYRHHEANRPDRGHHRSSETGPLR